MKKVLIVDDDSVTRGLLSRVLKPHAKEFEVLTAVNGKDAIEVINKEKVNLIITDLQMPEMDGFDLILHINKKHPEIPVFVMTAFGDSEIKAKITAIGALKYFEKPLNIDIITECIFEELDSGACGKIEGISLPSFLQLLEMESKTCTLRVRSENMSGRFFFFKGELMAAEANDFKDEEAAYELLCLDKIIMELDNVCTKKKKTVKQPLMNILMEGLKIKDERDQKDKRKKTPLKPLKSLMKKVK